MKLILENWRQYLKEQRESELGVYVEMEKGYTISLSLVNLSAIRQQLQNATSVQDFAQKLNNKEMYDAAIVGNIRAQHNPMLAKSGVSGGECGPSDSYSVIGSIGKGYGEQLYNALLGFAASQKDYIYITPDRNSVSPGASKRWKKVDDQTADVTPPEGEIYGRTFDPVGQKRTAPTDDDCKVHGVDHLDRGYRDTNQVAFYKKLKDNLDNFFVKEVEPMFEKPGFFAKLFGNTPESKALKIKKQLLKLGKDKFYDWINPATRNRAPSRPTSFTQDGADLSRPPFE